MKKLSYILLSLLLFIALACFENKKPQVEEIGLIETGVNPDAWVKIPAGEFLKGQHRHKTLIKKEYEMMVTHVTNGHYARYLNEALPLGVIKIDNNRIIGHYKGEPFDKFKHEFEIPAGDKIYINLLEPGIRIKFDGKTFSVVSGYQNHPVTFISWFGANAYAEFYGWRLPTENEWEKAARGTDTRTYPWGEEFSNNIANNIHSTLFKKVFGKDITTTPVGFFNGKTYSGYETRDNKSPFGLYDMAGNVWQWCGDDYPDQHYRYSRGGSRSNYGYDLFVWSRNNAGPAFYSMYFGFRCARDIPAEIIKE